jgi:hypothetical protein
MMEKTREVWWQAIKANEGEQRKIILTLGLKVDTCHIRRTEYFFLNKRIPEISRITENIVPKPKAALFLKSPSP